MYLISSLFFLTGDIFYWRYNNSVHFSIPVSYRVLSSVMWGRFGVRGYLHLAGAAALLLVAIPSAPALAEDLWAPIVESHPPIACNRNTAGAKFQAASTPAVINGSPIPG